MKCEQNQISWFFFSRHCRQYTLFILNFYKMVVAAMTLKSFTKAPYRHNPSRAPMPNKSLEELSGLMYQQTLYFNSLGKISFNIH